MAKFRFCGNGNRNREQDGSATRDRAFAEAADGAVVLDSIVKVFGRSIEHGEWRVRMANVEGFYVSRVFEKVRPLSGNVRIMIGQGSRLAILSCG